jgi:hypothetical protein
MALTLIELKDYVEMETPGEFQHAIIKVSLTKISFA